MLKLVAVEYSDIELVHAALGVSVLPRSPRELDELRQRRTLALGDPMGEEVLIAFSEELRRPIQEVRDQETLLCSEMKNFVRRRGNLLLLPPVALQERRIYAFYVRSSCFMIRKMSI